MIEDTLMSFIGNNVIGAFLAFFIALIPLIIAHELGHFFAARLAGVWVREFGIGYPPRIVKLFQWKETAFTLNWLPLGGFALMEGEGFMGEDLTEEEKAAEAPETRKKKQEALEHSLYTAAPGKRIGIYLAGPLMNLVTAWLLCVLLFATGVPAEKVTISAVAEGSPAEAVGLQEGDVIVAIDDQVMQSLDDVTQYTKRNLGEEVELTLKRDGSAVHLSIIPRENPPEGEGAMGIGIYSQFVPGQQRRYAIPRAVRLGSLYMARAIEMTIMMPISILKGVIPLKEARPVGIVGITQITQQSVEASVYTQSLYPFFTVLILISLSLGLFNLFPIPALDGGRILITLIEMVRGVPITPTLQERIYRVAFLFLFALFIIITAMDILYPIELPPLQ